MDALLDPPPPGVAGRRPEPRLRAIRTAAWVATVALVAVMGSERVYWYWTGIDLESIGLLTAFYSVAAGAALFALAATGGGSWRSLVAAGALFGLVVEGAITPVVYEDGPLPILLFLFVWWHGLLAFVGFFAAIRRWALDDRRRRMLLASVGVGVYWGAWALISAVVDRTTADAVAAEGGASAEIRSPVEFARYAGWVGAVLIGGHLLLGRLWPSRGWRPSRRAMLALGLTTVALAAVLVLPSVPWAPVKFAALAWMLWQVLRRDGVDERSPTMIDRLAGRVSIGRLAPIAAMPLTAALVYTALWPVRDASVMPPLFWTLTAQQVLTGAAAVVWLVWPMLRGRRPTARTTARATASPTSRPPAPSTWPAPAVRRAEPASAAVAALAPAGTCSPDDSGAPGDGAAVTADDTQARSSEAPGDAPAASDVLPAASEPTSPNRSAETHLGLTWFSPPADAVSDPPTPSCDCTS